MALLSFPINPVNGEYYPPAPLAGQNLYRWEASTLTWRLQGPATGVSPGTYGDYLLVPQITIDATGRITVATNVPIQLGDTTQVGLVQLVDNTATNDATKALTAAQGFSLQQQIDDLTIRNNLTFAGTFNASTAQMVQVTTEGTLVGFTVGSNLPTPVTSNKEYFVVVVAGGTYSPPGGGGPYVTSQGDWFVSSGTVWVFYDLGAPPPKFFNFDNVSSSFNGSRLAFPLNVGGVSYSPSPSTNIMVFVGGVPQEPGAAYTVTGSTIAFSSAPPTGSSFYATTVGV